MVKKVVLSSDSEGDDQQVNFSDQEAAPQALSKSAKAEAKQAQSQLPM